MCGYVIISNPTVNTRLSVKNERFRFRNMLVFFLQLIQFVQNNSCKQRKECAGKKLI